MRLASSFSLVIAAAAATAPSSWPVATPERPDQYVPEVTVVELHRSYVVKLGCLSCPYANIESQFNVSWDHPPRDNALLLKFDIDGSASKLLLNGRPILPLHSMPLDINALQVPADLTMGSMAELIEEDLSPSRPFMDHYPLQYQHTLLQTKVENQTWVQFDVTGLPFGETVGPVKMDKEGQKMIQILLGKQENSTELIIETLQVVERKDRVQPFRMRCGKLAMVQTSYDPNEWDEYGKLGTWSRTWNFFLSKLEDFWSENLQYDALLLPLALSLAFSIGMARRWYQQRQQEKVNVQDEMEVALLRSYYGETPPAYANVPIIKIEECD